MKNKVAEQKWWSALSGWMARYQGRADFLFVYDRKQGRLDRCFDKNVALSSVDAETISKLYQAAAEGRLGLLRPNDLKPQLLTTNPEKLFATGKEAAVAAVATEQESALPEQEENAETEKEAEPGLDARKMERAAADPDVAGRMREAEAHYRQVVYAPPKGGKPAPTEASGGENSAVRNRMKQIAALEQAADMVRNAMSLQPEDGFSNEQEQLVAGLMQMMLDISGTRDEDEERLEREKQARQELIAAQNMFIWAAVSEKRDQEAFEARMEWLEQKETWTVEPTAFIKEWKRQMDEMSRELYNMDLAGASEEECSEKIRDYLDGKRPVKQPENEEAEEARQEESEFSGKMWGNTLRHFCRFASSEAPLSIRHVQVAEQCRRMLQEAKQRGWGPEELGLDPQDQMVIRGTLEIGALVNRGLMAQAILTSGKMLLEKQYKECLRSYLAMKGVEEALIPHVERYQEEIKAGDGPVSAMQIVMANKGFHADDLRAKAGRTSAMARLERMEPWKVGQMIKRGDKEIAELGRQAMSASCQMGDAPEPVRAPQRAPQKGGPVR